jgi:hypothetical protein
MTIIPQDQWKKLKQVLIEQWEQITERELEATNRQTQEILNLMRFKMELSLDEASQKFSEILERVEKFEVPHEISPNLKKNKKESLRRTPLPPANRDRKPKDKFHL